jgi:glycosyltransferase involved in cell wall biosynthesis
MRICLYTDTALPKVGGQELVVDSLARQFQNLGQEVVVLAPHPRGPLQANDRSLPYPVVRHPRFISSRYLVGWYRRWLLQLHRERPFDVLHCHGLYPPGYLGALCRGTLGVPTVITSHGGDMNEGASRLAKSAVQSRQVQAMISADALVAISQFIRGR